MSSSRARLAALLAASLCSIVPTWPAPDRPRIVVPGVLPPTAEDTRWHDSIAVHVGHVNWNELGLRRVNDERRLRHLPPLPQSVAVPYGREIVSDDASSSSKKSDGSDSVLPPRVDNSLLDAFPPIGEQQGLGVCMSFAMTYNMMTHMTCIARGCDAKHGSFTPFSPSWTYNMVNGGEDHGGSRYANLRVMLQHGAASLDEFPFETSWNPPPIYYRKWSVDPNVWRHAIDYRMDKTGILDMRRDGDFSKLKQLLANGYVLTFVTNFDSWQWDTIGDDPSTPDDDDEVGKSIGTWCDGYDGQHVLTVVGYDDAIWVDINGNGVIDPGERGALRIANSWGKDWGDHGFLWMAYDAMNAVSTVPGGPGPGRYPTITEMDWVTARSSYHPRLTASFTLFQSKRDQVRITPGFSAAGRSPVLASWIPGAIQNQGGPHALDGTDVPVPGTFVFDLTDMLESEEAYDWSLGVNDSTAGDPTELRDFSVQDLSAGTSSAAPNMPQTVDAGDLSPKATLTTGHPMVVRETFDRGWTTAATRGWTVTSTGTNTGPTARWLDSNPGARVPGKTCNGLFMTADGPLQAPVRGMVTDLVTPAIDCSSLPVVRVAFEGNQAGPCTLAKCSESSLQLTTDDGATWQTIDQFSYPPRPDTHSVYDVSALASGQPRVQLRWHYETIWDTAGDDYWQVDDVKVFAPEPQASNPDVTLVISPADGGLSTPQPDVPTPEPFGLPFPITASPAAHHYFDHWEIDGTGWIDDVKNPQTTAVALANTTIVAVMPECPWHPDVDGDGFGASDPATAACDQRPNYVQNDLDCDDRNALAWQRPGEANNLRFGPDRVTLAWLPPTQPGARSITYDVLRSRTPKDFVAGSVCLATGIVATQARDVTRPSAGAALFYLARARNACPGGRGPVGYDSSGIEEPARSCP